MLLLEHVCKHPGDLNTSLNDFLQDELNHIGPGEARMGVIVYSSKITQLIPLTGDKILLGSELSNIRQPRMGTNTAVGIEAMRAMFTEQYKTIGVPKVGIVITKDYGILIAHIYLLGHTNFTRWLGDSDSSPKVSTVSICSSVDAIPDCVSTHILVVIMILQELFLLV
jgi:hypothetical protein